MCVCLIRWLVGCTVKVLLVIASLDLLGSRRGGKGWEDQGRQGGMHAWGHAWGPIRLHTGIELRVRPCPAIYRRGRLVFSCRLSHPQQCPPLRCTLRSCPYLAAPSACGSLVFSCRCPRPLHCPASRSALRSPHICIQAQEVSYACSPRALLLLGLAAEWGHPQAVPACHRPLASALPPVP